jgi:hypothetical protein
LRWSLRKSLGLSWSLYHKWIWTLSLSRSLSYKWIRSLILSILTKYRLIVLSEWINLICHRILRCNEDIWFILLILSENIRSLYGLGLKLIEYWSCLNLLLSWYKRWVFTLWIQIGAKHILLRNLKFFGCLRSFEDLLSLKWFKFKFYWLILLDNTIHWFIPCWSRSKFRGKSRRRCFESKRERLRFLLEFIFLSVCRYWKQVNLNFLLNDR